MKIEAKKLAELNKHYNKLAKDEKIISINEVKNRIEQLLSLKDELEDLLSEQMLAIETFNNSCEDGACEIDDDNEDVEQSELYNLYSDIEDIVLGGNIAKALRMIG